MKTKGISPKVLADLLVSFVTFALTAGVIEIDPVLAATISKLLGSLAAVIAPPGNVEIDAVPGGDGGQLGQANWGAIGACALVVIAVVLAVALL